MMGLKYYKNKKGKKPYALIMITNKYLAILPLMIRTGSPRHQPVPPTKSLKSTKNDPENKYIAIGYWTRFYQGNPVHAVMVRLYKDSHLIK